jgi:hypothetical protein
VNAKNNTTSKSARTYTLGGLHMSVIEELRSKEQLKAATFNPLNIPKNTFVSLNVVLKPVDFFQILEVVNLLKPLITKILTDFGGRINQQVFTKNVIREIPKYDELAETIIRSLEDDYLKSKQLEMLMVSPETSEVIGIVDIDLTDLEPTEIKAKSNDGQFYVIGKVSRYIEEGESMSMVQRTLLSKIVELLGKVLSLNLSEEKMLIYNISLSNMQPIVEKFIKLSLAEKSLSQSFPASNVGVMF